MLAVSIENLRKTKISCILFKKTLSRSIVYRNCGQEYEKIFKEREWIEILKIFGLINNKYKCQNIYNHVSKKNESIIRTGKIENIRNYLIKEKKSKWINE